MNKMQPLMDMELGVFPCVNAAMAIARVVLELDTKQMLVIQDATMQS